MPTSLLLPKRELHLDPLFIDYSLRNLLARKTQTALTVIGIALVVFIFTATLMLAEGVRYTLASTGDMRNAILVSSGAQNEMLSGIPREQVAILRTDEAVARAEDAGPMVGANVVVVITLNKRDDEGTSNATFRGVSRDVYSLRDNFRILQGRLPVTGSREVIVGRGVQRKFTGTEVGQTLRIVGLDWPVVGVFDLGNSGFSSEIWGDAEVLLPTFKREQFSSVVMRLKNGVDFEQLKMRLESDRRLSISIQREPDYFEAQSKSLSMVIRVLGLFVTVIFSLGAILGAMITMYNSVSNRIREIGVLRALGFSKKAIQRAFLKESALIGLLGSIVALVLASALINLNFTTTNYDSLAELAFTFRLNFSTASLALGFGVCMGLIGGYIPCWWAGLIPITTALRRG